MCRSLHAELTFRSNFRSRFDWSRLYGREIDLIGLRFKRAITGERSPRDRSLAPRSFVRGKRRPRLLPVLLSSVGTLLLVFVLSTTTLARPSSSGTTYRRLLDQKKKRTKNRKNRNENETLNEQHWKRAVQHVYVPKYDLRIVIIIPLFFRGCLSESPPPRTHSIALLSCEYRAPRSRPVRGPGIIDCSRIQVKLLRFH